MEHYNLYGIEYPIRVGALIAGSLIAMFTDNRRYHAIFVSVALLYEIAFTLRHFATLS
jgi:hypothetical protein